MEIGYGKKQEFERFLRLRGLGLAHFEYKPLWDLIAMPALLKYPKIFGKVGIIYGKK